MPKFINSRTLKVLLLSYGIFAWPIVNSTQAQTITYTDQAGRLVKLDKIPERIATIATPAGSMVVTLSGNGDRLVGTSQNSKNALIEGVLNEFFPILNNVSSNIIGNEGNANIEELLNLETDLVLQWARNTKSIEAMENAGLNVVGMRYKKIDIAKTWLTDIGIILRNSSKAEEILAWHDATYKRITDKTRTIKQADKPTVLYLINDKRAAGPASHFQFFMDTAGATNAMLTGGQFVDVDAEMVLNSDPDIIWLFGFNLKMTPDKIYDNPIYADLKAVKNHRIYKVPIGGDRWDPPNQEFALGWEWFTRTVHPDLLEGSIRESIKTAYPMLYGKVPTDAQIDQILRVEMNKGALNYAKIIQ